ncbi:hypothetical protein BC830DRAFT_1210861 [Chytriomyces sp. MP71]|nr:hypothetical protein BC830DRAFT_1210861 [Chytriomyces sp. MP71]
MWGTNSLSRAEIIITSCNFHHRCILQGCIGDESRSPRPNDSRRARTVGWARVFVANGLYRGADAAVTKLLMGIYFGIFEDASWSGAVVRSRSVGRRRRRSPTTMEDWIALKPTISAWNRPGIPILSKSLLDDLALLLGNVASELGNFQCTRELAEATLSELAKSDDPCIGSWYWTSTVQPKLEGNGYALGANVFMINPSSLEGKGNGFTPYKDLLGSHDAETWC